MAKQIYRQAALDRLTSPEQLDQPHSIVAAQSWWVLLGLVTVAMLAVVGAIFSFAPVKVPARGILLQSGGLLEIVANHSGRIDAFKIKVGDIVTVGMPVAEFKRPILIRDIKLAKADLADTRNRLEKLAAYYAQQEKNMTLNEQDRLEGMRETETLLTRRQKLLEERLKGVSKLVDRKIALPTTQIDVELEIAGVLEKRSNLSNETNTLRTTALTRKSQQDLDLLDEQLKIDKLKRQITRLENQLQEEQVIRSPHAGRVIEIKMNRGDVVSNSQPLALLAPLTKKEDPDIAVLYVSPADGKRIKEGMKAEVVPSLYRKAQYGFINSEVIFVSSVPATLEGMRRVLRNEQLAKQLSGGSSPFEVRVRFKINDSTPSGLSWSSSKGPDASINPGTILEASIVTEKLSIADMIFPGLAEKIGVAAQ